MNEALLSLRDIHYRYSRRPEPVLRGAGFDLFPGRSLGLLGGNGCGKSTLLHLAVGLIRPDSGQVIYKGRPREKEEDFADLRLEVGYLLQHSEDQLFCPTVLEDVAFGPLNQGLSPAQAESAARAALDSLNQGHLAGRTGADLSGGEKKMAALATILAMRPQVLLLDEPSNDLDKQGREIFLRTLQNLPAAKIVVSHDWDFVSRVCTDYLLLEDGSLGPAAVEAHSHVHMHPAGGAEHAHD